MSGFDNEVVYADNWDFRRSSTVVGQVTTAGQLPIGTGAADPLPSIEVGVIKSNGGTILVTYDAPDINLELAGGGTGIDSVAVQTGAFNPVVPDGAGQITINGSTVLAGTNPVRTDGTGANTLAVEVQIAQAIAAPDATNVGLAAFDLTSFAVDADGFVTLAGGVGTTWNDVSGAFSPLKNNGYFITGTATGTLPASPSQGDTIKFFVDHATQDLTIDAPGTQIIRMGAAVTAAGGTAVSTAQGDSVELTYRAADTCWCAIGGLVGVWILT